MRTKLFLAFIFIIFFALLSNVVFKKLIIRDFDDFIRGTEEDRIYWIMASVEGSYNDGEWNMALLTEAVHWSMMLGFEAYVEDPAGNRVLSSSDALSTMNPNMMDRMSSLLNLTASRGEFTWYPLYVGGDEIGKIFVRAVERSGIIPLKEEIFRTRGRNFLIISFLIAGGGALVMSLLFTLFLSNPLRRLNESAGKIADGDFSVRVPLSHKKYKDEIDELTETFNFMAEGLMREDSLRKHLTSNIAHELRTPLTIIRGNLEAIEDGVISDQGKVMENVTSEIRRLTSLVEGIEDVTRAEASFFKKGSPEELNLEEFSESIAEGMRQMIEEKGLYIKTEGPCVTVLTYPEKLHIILKNLLSNAYKFTEKGGITIQWDIMREDGETGFYMSVSDTGKGIAKGELSRIFDRFHKDSESGGKGLGLAIVKELVEVMDGTVDVQSGPGCGAIFKVVFS